MKKSNIYLFDMWVLCLGLVAGVMIIVVPASYCHGAGSPVGFHSQVCLIVVYIGCCSKTWDSSSTGLNPRVPAFKVDSNHWTTTGVSRLLIHRMVDHTIFLYKLRKALNPTNQTNEQANEQRKD